MSFEIIRSRIFGLKPVGREDLVSDHDLYDVLFPDHGTSKTYAFIDGARIPDLEERLEAHPGKAICLDGRRDSHETVWSLPWLVEIGEDDRITRNLLSDHPIRGMWYADPGLFMETTYPSGVGAVSGVFGLPVPRHKIVDAIDFVLRQALEDPCEPCFGVDVVQLAGFHERIGDCSRFSAAD